MNIEHLLSELTLEEKASLCSGADFWRTKPIERLGIPKVMMCDGPNGLRKQLGEGDHLGINESIKAVCFPTSGAVAASFDRNLAQTIGETLGNECQAENVSMLLGPGVNIKRSPLCGRNFEYYSEDPLLSAQMATAYIKGLQSKGVGACIKHYAANNQETKRLTGDSVVDERTLREVYLSSFESAVKEAKPMGVMCSYNRVNGTFAAENKQLLTDILRTEWGYNGMVVTDWGAVKNRVRGIEAGLDLEMPGGSGGLVNDAQIVQAVQEGSLSIDVLDNVVRNLLTFIDKAVSQRDETAAFNRDNDYQIALEAAKECAVLLKNDQHVLPLQKGTKSAFIGGFIEKPRIQGSGSSFINSSKIPAIAQLIQGRSDIEYARGFDLNKDETDEALLNEAVALAKASQVAVIFAGLPGCFEAEGADRKHINLPDNQNALIAAVCAVQPNTVVVLSNGSPVAMPWVNHVPAILEMYLAGDGASEATMALLYGDSNPCGKLAETFPMRLQDTPCYLDFPGERGVTEYREGVFVGYRWYDKREMSVLFPFGHGLSYTAFAYSDLKLSKEAITDKDLLSVSVTVTNIGSCFGKEVVQLYVGENNSEVRRPIRELKAFEKVALTPGESKTVTFSLDKRAFTYYETVINDWFAPSGQYAISVGSSSRDLRACSFVQMNSSQCLPIVVTGETSLSELARHPATAPLIEQLIQNVMTHFGASSQSDNSELGEGAEALKESAMELPFGALLTFGELSKDEWHELLKTMQTAVKEGVKQR